MELVSAGVEILTPINGEEILKHIERCGRVCYKSEDKITDGSAERFVAGLIRRGHESVLEHYSITVKFTCDRGVSHEIVRHRLASYSQESTRYCDYSGGITFVWPCYLTAGTDEAYDWINACGAAEKAYKRMISDGMSPQQVRTVLPNATKTELVMTTNLREWRTVLKQRTAKAAHPQMREVMLMLLTEFKDRIPIVFDDIEVTD